EKETAELREVAKPLRARLQQLQNGEQPRMAARHVLVVPEPVGLEPRLDASRELVRRHPPQMVLVEPLELLGIENGVAAADAVEREHRRELVAREDLAIAAPRRPPEEREKIHHRFG